MHRNKKLFTLIATLILIVFSFTMAGCGGSNSEKTSSDATPDKAAEKKVYNLKMNYSFAAPNDPADPKQHNTEDFVKRIEEATDGQVKIQIYYSNQLVPYQQALEAMEAGTIDMNSGGSYWGEILPTQDFTWLPYGFYGSEYVRHLMRDTEIGDISTAALESRGVKCLYYYPLGDQGMLSKFPIKKVSDINGKLVRIGTGLWTNWYKAIGAAPVSIAGTELYEALMRNTIDVAMYPVYTFKTAKLNEVAKHATLPAVLEPSTCACYISMKAWDKIPADLQKIIEEVCLQMEEEAIPYNEKYAQESIKWSEANGVTINYLTQAEYEAWVESAQVAWDDFAAKSDDCKKMVEILRADRETYFEKNAEAKAAWDARMAK